MVLMPRLEAQTLNILHSFSGDDGANPYAGLILSGTNLYGTTYQGGTNGNGTVFSVSTNGTGFTILYSFQAKPNGTTNSDGANPRCRLLLVGNTLYGAAVSGGTNGAGTVFRVNTDGTGFMNLHSFIGASDGYNPAAGLILSGTTLYGTAAGGGAYTNGTVFAINTNGTGFTVLHSFSATSGIKHTNSDGAHSVASLILSDNTLYGTAQSGGSYGYGTVFAITTNGTSFTTLHSFDYSDDGGFPYADLILTGTNLYGTSEQGSAVAGTIFRVNTNGTVFSTLYNFTGGNDGANPYAGLILSGTNLFGTAEHGGSLGNGTIFNVNTNGAGFTTLYNFTGGNDGANPYYAELFLLGKNLYGTAAFGGINSNGTIFSLAFVPQLAIASSGTNVILTWPSGAAGFSYSGYTLQSTTNLTSATVWSNVSASPVVVNTTNVLTNAIFGTREFFRLSQ